MYNHILTNEVLCRSYPHWF